MTAPETTTPPLPPELALRIALAARALPDTDVAQLLQVLDDAVGLPPTVAKLDGLTVKHLKSAAGGELAGVGAQHLKRALAYLKGEGLDDCDPPPNPEPYAEGDLPGSIRVACASNGGELLDGHFGSCRRFLIYQVSAAATRLIDVREITDDPDSEDKNADRAGLIADCQVLYVASIGGPAAAKVVKRDIHPIRFPDGGNAREKVAGLQPVLAHKPPPWLAKVMGMDTEKRVRFAREAMEA